MNPNNSTNNSTNNNYKKNNSYKKHNNYKSTNYNNKKLKYNQNNNQNNNLYYNPYYIPTYDTYYNPTYDPYYNPTYDPYYIPIYDPYYIPTYDTYYNPTYDPYYIPIYDPYANPPNNLNINQPFFPPNNLNNPPFFPPNNLNNSQPTNLPDISLVDLLNSLKSSDDKITVEKPVVKTQKNIDFTDIKIESLEDLVKLIDNNKYDSQYEYNIDLEGLTKIKDDLIQLINMIGLKKLKKSIFEQILYFIQKLQSDDFKHTVLYGPPGTGKTEVAKILGRIYSKIGILSKNIFKKVSRSDLVAGYLGQTAIKTKDVIKQCLGGVLFIDEAYSLGTVSKTDSFSRECIDTICHESSEHKKDLIIMIAGYENELKESFFELNKGLDSRFIWRFEFEPYSAYELSEIFLLKIKESAWNIDIDTKELQKWFETNINSFKFFGRDIEVLFLKTKIAHSRRIFGLDKEFIKKINMLDLNNGFILFKESIKEKKSIISSMYC